MRAKPKNIDEFIAAVDEDKRATLEKLRQTIRSIVPKAEECISYGLAAFRLNGKSIVGFGASANHCALYPMSGSTVETLKDVLKKYDTSKGVIRFVADKPLPAALVRKVIQTRIAENAALDAKKGKNPASRTAKAKAGNAQTDPEVIAFLKELDHPLKKEIEMVRQIILGVSPKICEGIKWNAPSFRTTDYFATLNLHKGRVWLILHTGAKPKASAKTGLQIADPKGLLKWLAKDRCLVMFDDSKDVKAKRTALEAIVREWMEQV